MGGSAGDTGGKMLAQKTGSLPERRATPFYASELGIFQQVPTSRLQPCGISGKAFPVIWRMSHGEPT
jgi:hypothetical protein